MVNVPKTIEFVGLTALETTTEEGSKIELLVGFLADTSIQSVKRPTDDDVGTWYYHVRS